MTFTVTSDAFEQGRPMLVRYSCMGEDISPVVRWTQAPIGTVSFAVIIDDPDAHGGVFTHWLVYDIPANQSELPEALPNDKMVAGGIRQGTNDFGTVGYRGPCPPRGSPHHYVLRVYALNSMVILEGGADRETFDTAMKGHVLATSQVTTTFGR